MQTQQRFVSTRILIATVLGLIVVGGGAYFVLHSQSDMVPARSDAGIDNNATTTVFVLPPQLRFDPKNPPLIVKPPTYPQPYYLYVANHTLHLAGIRDQWDCSVRNQAGMQTPYVVSDGIVIKNSDGQLCLEPLYDIRTVGEVIDPDSLHYIASSTYYLADRSHVYLARHLSPGRIYTDDVKFVPTPGADPNSFRVLDDINILLGKDARAVYVQDKVLQGADASTLKLLNGSWLYGDVRNFYVGTSTVFVRDPYASYDPFEMTLIRIDYAAVSTKSVDTKSGYSGYSVAGNSVQYDDVYGSGSPSTKQLIVGADPKTLVLVSGLLDFYGGLKDKPVYLYAKDVSHVYYRGKIISGADPTTFRAIENGSGYHSYGKDAGHVFFEDKIIPGADVNMFKILWQPIYEGCGQTHYSKDATQVYFGSTAIVGADPATFESLINGYGKDKNGYFKGTINVGATIDQKELVCNYG